MSNEMQEHFGINDVEFKRIIDEGVTIADLVRHIYQFDVHQTNCAIGKIQLMHYIDKHGDFTGRKTKGNKIAFAIFNSLKPSDKTEIIKYIPDEDDLQWQ